MTLLLDTSTVCGGTTLTGFKWYDFNGYASAYDLTVTYTKVSTVPSGFWWYCPQENLGMSSLIPYEYSKGATTSGGVVLRKTLTINQI